jgi:uncharacterized protein YacL (UPF0231 family)
MFLVVVHWFQPEIQDTICIVAETEEKAQEWIDNEMKDNVYNGAGVHNIIPVKLYK